MIKVTDLMINDWVCINNSNFQVKDIKKKSVIKLYENTQWGEHEIEVNNDYLEEFLQPIQLTTEILEKNGFYGESQCDGKVTTYYIGNGYYLQQYNTQKNYTLVDNVLDDEVCGYESNHIRPIKYIHELQHALNFLEIDKQIII